MAQKPTRGCKPAAADPQGMACWGAGGPELVNRQRPPGSRKTLWRVRTPGPSAYWRAGSHTIGEKRPQEQGKALFFFFCQTCSPLVPSIGRV